MVGFRPHTLRYQSITGGSENADGSYTPGASEFIGEIPCRAVLNGRAAEVMFEDGHVFRYAYVVYLDLTDYASLEESGKILKSGDVVQVLDGEGRKVLELPMHGNPHIKQLHVKLYV